MLIGYSRVSQHDQNDQLQLDALTNAGCQKIFSDKISGSTSERPGLTKLKEHLRTGDTLVIWRFDRLSRSLKDLIDWSSYLEKEGIALKSVHEAIDTSTTNGKLVFHIFASIAQFERSLMQERTKAGLASARMRGRLGGRPLALPDDKREVVIGLYNDKKFTVKKICDMMEISKPTLYKYIKTNKTKK